MTTTYQTPSFTPGTRVAYQAHWMTEAQDATIIRQIKPAGRIGRFFGANVECFVITVDGDPHSFTTQVNWLQA
jgi:hypothetical protein